MGLNLKKLMKSDYTKVGLAAGAGFVLGKYAPTIQGKLTDVRKIVQAKRSSLFPNYGKGADKNANAAPEEQGGLAYMQGPMEGGASGGGFFARLLDLIFGRA